MNKSNTRPLQAWEINAEWDCLCGICGVDLEGECSGGCNGEGRMCVCGECGDKDSDDEEKEEEEEEDKGYDSDDEEEDKL